MKTDLTVADLARLLAPFDLRPRSMRPLEVGTVNSNYFVATDGGPVFVRVNEGKSEADVRFEAALLWHLGARRFPTPQPLRRGDGRPYVFHGAKCVTAFPWADGRTVPDEQLTPDHCGRLGVVLARLHRAAADFPERRPGIYTFERIVERIERVRAEPSIQGALPILDEEVAWLRAHRAPDLPSGTIHGDLFPDNVLFRGPELTCVLDFEQASFGRLAYDVAVSLLAWCWTGNDLDGDRCRALARGYREVRPFEPVEESGLYAEARFAALRFTTTRITDVHLAGVERAGKDFRDYLARLLRLRELGPDRFRSLVLESTSSSEGV